MAMDSPVMVAMMVTVVTEGSWPVQMVDDVAGLRMGGADARQVDCIWPTIAFRSANSNPRGSNRFQKESALAGGRHILSRVCHMRFPCDARRLAHGVPGVAQARDLDAVL